MKKTYNKERSELNISLKFNKIKYNNVPLLKKQTLRVVNFLMARYGFHGCSIQLIDNDILTEKITILFIFSSYSFNEKSLINFI